MEASPVSTSYWDFGATPISASASSSALTSLGEDSFGYRVLCHLAELLSAPVGDLVLQLPTYLIPQCKLLAVLAELAPKQHTEELESIIATEAHQIFSSLLKTWDSAKVSSLAEFQVKQEIIAPCVLNAKEEYLSTTENRLLRCKLLQEIASACPYVKDPKEAWQTIEDHWARIEEHPEAAKAVIEEERRFFAALDEQCSAFVVAATQQMIGCTEPQPTTHDRGLIVSIFQKILPSIENVESLILDRLETQAKEQAFELPGLSDYWRLKLTLFARPVLRETLASACRSGANIAALLTGQPQAPILMDDLSLEQRIYHRNIQSIVSAYFDLEDDYFGSILSNVKPLSRGMCLDLEVEPDPIGHLVEVFRIHDQLVLRTFQT